MRLLSLLIPVACLPACGQQPAYSPTEHHGGRYLGIGVYPVDNLWRHLATPNPNAGPHAARLADDSQLIVVVDSNTGEIRQCGNLSGHCIRMNPWTASLGQGQSAPVALDKHEEDLAREGQEAANDQGQAYVVNAMPTALPGRR